MTGLEKDLLLKMDAKLDRVAEALPLLATKDELGEVKKDVQRHKNFLTAGGVFLGGVIGLIKLLGGKG